MIRRHPVVVLVVRWSQFADFSEAFGGATIGGGIYTFPSGADSWAGFANTNTAMYPLAFPAGGKITFVASIPNDGSAGVYFRFERLPYDPNDSGATEPSYNTESVTIAGTDHLVYEVEVPAQGTNTFSSFLLYIETRDEPVMIGSVQVESYDDSAGPMDTDMDGVPDDEDAFPTEPAASVDADMDGMPDAWNDGATQEQIDASGLMLDDDPTTPGGGPGGPMEPPVADFTGVFGGAQAGADNTFTVPTG